MTSLIYYQCTTYLSEEWFFTDSSVETATFTASAIDNTSLSVATQKSYELVIDQSFKYVNARYPDRTITRCVTTIKRDTNFNGDGNITAGLLELTGPFSNNDIPLKNTFEYDPITKDRQYFTALREDFSVLKVWIINSLIFDYPLLGSFVANKIM